MNIWGRKYYSAQRTEYDIYLHRQDLHRNLNRNLHYCTFSCPCAMNLDPQDRSVSHNDPQSTSSTIRHR